MVNENNGNDGDFNEEIIEVDLPALFGDLCEVEGYGQRVFKVFGYRIESCYTAEREWTDVVYELIDAVNGEWVEADVEDIELLADAEDAEVYMQTVDYANYPMSFMQSLGYTPDGWSTNNVIGGDGMAGKKPERKPTAREMSAKLAEERKQARKDRYEALDNELDRYNFFKRMYETTKERRYKESMDTVMSEIKKLRNEQ